MAQTIILKHVTTTAITPLASELSVGEVALNTADGLMFFKKNDDTILVFKDSSNFAELTGGKLSASVLPTSAMEYKGNYNASTNTPDLTDAGTLDTGDMFVVSATGTQDLGHGAGSIEYTLGGNLIWNGSSFEYSPPNETADASTIKSLYESNADTNALTDANLTKLNNITLTGSVNLDSDFATSAQGATADSALQSGANISTLTNDSNFIANGNNISLLTNDSGFINSTATIDGGTFTGASPFTGLTLSSMSNSGYDGNYTESTTTGTHGALGSEVASDTHKIFKLDNGDGTFNVVIWGSLTSAWLVAEYTTDPDSFSGSENPELSPSLETVSSSSETQDGKSVPASSDNNVDYS